MPNVYLAGHPLRSAYLKTRRAHLHINALKRSIRRSFNPQATIREQTIAQGPLEGLNVVTVGIDPSLKAESWGLMIGDIVTNLRDSLDHITWALTMVFAAERGTKLTDQEARGVQFPLEDEPSSMADNGRGGRALKCIPVRAHNEIRRFQPYNRRKLPELDLLRDLKLLANMDKHRLVTPTNVRARITLSKDDPGIVAILDQQRDSQFLNNPGHNLEPNISYEIAVYPRDALHPLNIDRLPLMTDFIRSEVLPAFAGFF